MAEKTPQERLKEYEAKGCHMLIPSAINAENIAQGFALVIETVLLKPHPKDKDVYPDESSEYDWKGKDWKTAAKTGNERIRLHKQGLDRLAQAAKIDWSPIQIISDPVHTARMMAHVEGMIRTSTGELYRVTDSKGMDLEIEKEKLDFQYRDKDEKTRSYLVQRDLLQQKSYQQEKCISGAKARVIRQILCISNAYTVNDIKKEFVVARIVPKLDTSDEYTRKRLVDMQIAAMAGIYGLTAQVPPPKQIEMVGDVPEDACRKNDDVIDADEAPADNHPPEDNPPFGMDDQPTKTESLRMDFEACDEAGQVKTLTRMAGEKKFALPAWLRGFKNQPATLESIGPAQRLRLYDFLTQGEEGGKAA